MNEQERLLNIIWHDDPTIRATSGFDIRGIDIYRRNLLANAQRALSISFPTIFQLLDSDVSESLVYQFFKKSPPHHGDWAQWGQAFSQFIISTKIGTDYPYLADCAALDWHVHCARHGIDQSIDQSSLQRLADSEPEHIYVEFNQNISLIKTKYPITEIFHGHHHTNELQRNKAMNSAQEALTVCPIEHIVMVYRPEFQPMVTRLPPLDGVFIESLLSGASLTSALNLMDHDSCFSFETWLIAAIKQNLIFYFKQDLT